MSALFVSSFLILLFFLKRRIVRRLNALPIEELEKQTFSYPEPYFQFIGETDEAVKRYRDLITRKDLENLKNEWNTIVYRFCDLEKKAGHRGRPTIMDYFYMHEVRIQVLAERLKKSGAT